MPTRFALAVAVATTLLVAGCSSANAGDAPGGGETARSSQASQAQDAGGAQGDHAAAQDAVAVQDAGAAQAGSATQEGASAQAGPAQGGTSEAEAEAAPDGGEETADAEEAAEAGAFASGIEASFAHPGEPGLPVGSGASIDDVLRLGAVATWLDGRELLAISVPATLDCWPTAAAPEVVSAARLAIAFTTADCGLLTSARTYTFNVPAGIDARAALEVVIEGLEHHFTLTLPAAR